VAVVGAGPGGLGAALLLQGRGLQVDLFEAADRPGGRGRGRRTDGFTLESGPVFFHGPWVLDKLLRRAGVEPDEVVRYARIPEPGFRYRFGDGRFLDLSPDLDRLTAQVEAFEPGAGDRLRGFLARGEAAISPGMEMFMTQPVRGWVHHVFGPHMEFLWRLKPWRTLGRVLDRTFRSPELRVAFSLPCAYMGARAHRVSSAMSMVAAMEIGDGFFYPRGGFPGLYASLADCFGGLGGSLHLESPVEQILVRDRAARGVRVGGEEVAYDAVVVNADLAWACRNLLPAGHRPHLSDRKLDRMRYSSSVYVLALGLAEAPALESAYQIDLVSEEIASGFHRRPELALDEDSPMMMIATTSATDPSLAPEGGASLQASVIVPNLDHPVDWEERRQRLRALILKRLDQLAPGASSSVVRELEIAPPDWRDRFRVERGAVFSFSHDNQQVGSFRPANHHPRLDRLYWVGAGTHPGSGLFPILLSSVIADDLVARDGLGRAPRPWELRVSPEDWREAPKIKA